MKGSGLFGEMGDLAIAGDADRASARCVWLDPGRELDLGCRAGSVKSGASCWPILLFRGGNRVGTGPASWGAGDMRLETGETTA
jgi:hypothetical protein